MIPARPTRTRGSISNPRPVRLSTRIVAVTMPTRSADGCWLAPRRVASFSLDQRAKTVHDF
jgi:hypothetical protein